MMPFGQPADQNDGGTPPEPDDMAGMPRAGKRVAAVAGVLAVAAAVVALAAFGVGRGGGKGGLAGGNELTAEKLLAAFAENHLAASKRFDGRVTVRGEVSRIIFTSVLLEPGLGCDFRDSQENALSRLRPGQTVRVRGKVSSFAALVTLTDCELLD